MDRYDVLKDSVKDGCRRAQFQNVASRMMTRKGTDNDMMELVPACQGTEPWTLRNRSFHVGTGADLSMNGTWHAKEQNLAC